MTERNVRLRAESAVVTGRVGEAEPAPAHNLSMGGVFLATERRWPLGGVERLTIELDGRELHTGARVTHIRHEGVGFAFVSPAEEFRAAIREIIDALLWTDDDGEDGGSADQGAGEPVAWSLGSHTRRAVLRDLSHGGAFVVADSPPPEGAEIVLYLPGYTYSRGTAKPSELRGCRAQVVGVGEDGFTCRFVEPSAEFRMGIAERIAAG